MPAGRALDVPTTQTLMFVDSALPALGRLLEVGGGDGRLAAALQQRGHAVAMVDADADAVAAARGRGVDAHCACFPEGPDGPFDAVLFTRSLHHVADLDACLDRAVQLVRLTGVIVIEDWAWDAMDDATLLLCEQFAVWAERAGGTVDDLWQTGAAGRAHWRHAHGDHGLHPGAALDAAVRRCCAHVASRTAPYAYRYLSRYVQALPAASVLAEGALVFEEGLIACGAVQPLGRRWVGGARKQ